MCHAKEPPKQTTTSAVLWPQPGEKSAEVSKRTNDFRAQAAAVTFEEGANTLAQIIRRLSYQSTRRLAPQPYRELFFELSLNTPVCGIFQIAGNEEAIEVVQLVASGVDIRQCQYQVELKLL